MEKIIIVGGCAMGMSVAAKVKRGKKSTAVVVYEKGSILSFGACGLPYYVAGYFDNEEQMVAKTPEDFAKAGIETHCNHTVVGVDPLKKTIQIQDNANGVIKEDTYDKLVIATGASGIIPSIEGINLPEVAQCRTMDDGRKLKKWNNDPKIKKVAIIGAGYIGLEMVEALHHKGKEIHIFQKGNRVLMEAFDKVMTDSMEEQLKGKGINLYTETTVVKICGEKSVEAVETEAGSIISVDAVVIATGAKPNTAFLKDTGIEMLTGGAIIINNKGETSLPSIYAGGDCASVYHKILKKNVYIPLATTANKIGRTLGAYLAGEVTHFDGTLGAAAIKVLDLEAARVGITEQEARAEGIDYKVVHVVDKNQTNYYPGQESIAITLVYHAQTRHILGGQIIGKKGAVLRVDAIAIAIAKQMTVDELSMADLCYAPPFARTWDALNIAGSVAK